MNPGDNQEQINAAVATLLAGAPPAIQTFLAGPDRERITQSLIQKYALTADQANAFEQTLIFLLLGVSNPHEFISSLQTSNISSSIAESLVKDVNDQVFKPLQQTERAPQASLNTAPIAQPMQLGMQPPSVTVIPPAPTITPPSMQAPLPASPLPQLQPKMTEAPKNVPGPKNDLHQVLKSYGIDPYRERPE